MHAPVKALLFDIYGTLFDVHSVIEKCEQLFPGKGQALSQLWRSKQLEYTWLRTCMNRYEPFHKVTGAGLDTAARNLKLDLTPAAREQLLQQYLHLQPFADVIPALQRLNTLPLAVFSNGSLQMLSPLLDNSKLEKYFSYVISVDERQLYKPHPQVYEMARQHLDLPAQNLALVSSNYWDVCGAVSFGLQAFWINRSGQTAEELGQTPTAVFKDLGALAQRLS